MMYTGLLGVVIGISAWFGAVERAARPAAETPAIVAQLQQSLIPLRGAEPGGSTTDLVPLKGMIGNARLVGLGEGTHGTSEFFSMKDRLFRYMVENMGFTVFAMEANWTDGLTIDHYLTTGEGSIRDALHATFAVWDNQETLDLLEWMRAYNAAPGTHAMLRFVGIDMQSPLAATDMVTDYYQAHNPQKVSSIVHGYACIHSAYTELYAAFSKLSTAQKDACIADVAAIQTAVIADTQNAPLDERRTIRHAALVAAQATHEWTALTTTGGASRDAAMAENTEWVLRELYPTARVALWAHNGHVAADLSAYTNMGTLLRRDLGKDYYVIGFSFDRGDVSLNGHIRAALGPGPAGSSEALFRQAGVPYYLLDLRAIAPVSPLGAWLSHDRPFAMLGALNDAVTAEKMRDYPMAISKAFDSAIFVEQTHAAHSFAFATQQDEPILPRAGGRAVGAGWMKAGTAPALYAIGSDSVAAHTAGPSIWISGKNGEQGFGTVMHGLDIDSLRGKRVRVAGFLKTENVEGHAQFWTRVDGAARELLAFDNMDDRPLTGTAGWTPFSIVLDVPQTAARGFMGLMLIGTGKAWADDLVVTVVPQTVPVTAAAPP